MQLSRLKHALFGVVMTTLVACNVTMSDLHAINPQAAMLTVPCHPWQIRENVKLFSVRLPSDHIVTDETQSELLESAQDASVFIEVNASAPHENAAIMASDYGLVCQQNLAMRSTPLESLRPEEPCPAEEAQKGGSANPNLVAEPGKPPCDSSGQTKAVKKAPPVRIKVCVRPPWLPKPYKDAKGRLVQVTEWAITLSDKKSEWTEDSAHYAEQVAAHADVIFVFDKSAPLESAYYFTKDPKKLHCESGAPTKSYDDLVGSADMPMLSEVTASREAKEKAAAGNGKGQTSSTNPNGKGDGKTSASSSPDGHGPPLTFFEEVTRQMAIAAKLVSTDTSGSLKDPNGSRHGMPGGKNVGGFSFPPLQAGVATIEIVSSVFLTPERFIKKVGALAAKGQRAVINEVNGSTLKLADELINKFSQYEMAKGLEEMETIVPYALGEKFTKGLGGKFQAHKIFEKRAFNELEQGISKEALDKAVEKAPSIILTDFEHKEISKALDAAWRAQRAKVNRQLTKADLREIYKKVYGDRHPHWLDAIESYLR